MVFLTPLSSKQPKLKEPGNFKDVDKNNFTPEEAIKKEMKTIGIQLEFTSFPAVINL